MGSWSYASLEALKRQLADALTADDALYRQKLEAAAEEVDAICGRTFRVHLATIYPRVALGRLLVGADLLAVTALATDDDGDRVYETTWTSTDYDLLPTDAAVRRAPYWEIATAPNAAVSFPLSDRRGVELAAKLGYREDLAAAGTIAEDLDVSETGVDLTAGHGLETLETILVDAEQMYVTGFASANTATVERGVNGTTAAAHASGAAVRRYRYPALVGEAQLLIAEELLRPFGVPGRTDDTQAGARVLPLPHRVGELLGDFRLVGVA